LNRTSINKDQKRLAYQFIILLGFVSLCGDITYEGARGITGPFLSTLGASAAAVGLVAGLGEFLGYGLRLVSGYLADRTERYWLFTFIGYGLLLSIPLLAFAGHWQIAAILIIVERIGKAVRTPARDVILSYSTKQVGRGWGFGLHEALDQVGAIIGPLLFSLVFLFKGSYCDGFRLLWIPAILTIAILALARRKVPVPERLERPTEDQNRGEALRPTPKTNLFWIYTLFTFLAVAGFANFQVIAYHLKVKAVFPIAQIPLFYAVAMGIDALVALGIGKLYDKIGLSALIAIPLLTIPIPFLGFSQSYGLAVAGVLLWGAVMGIHETVMRAAIADLTPIRRRGLSYGIFNTAYGGAWFLGSALIGILYEISINYLILFVVVMELISLPALFLVMKSRGHPPVEC
jgi:MFS family permease